MPGKLQPPDTALSALQDVQFIVDREGQQTGVFLSLDDWEALLDWLEDLEDRALVRSILPRLRQGPDRAGALPWARVEAEWNDGAS